jgi:putative Mg2+ transporter-C (MgtC) family protein
VLVACTQHDFAVSRVRVERERPAVDPPDVDTPPESLELRSANDPQSKRIVTVALEIQGIRSVAKLAAKLAEINGVVSVNAGDVNIPSD